MTESLRAPFPWFGGKSRAAHIVWAAFGNVPNYVEPFFGSGAVPLLRPHEPKIETVNDADCHLANFWRAVQIDPDAVAQYCDWPVNEADLHARHRWLVRPTEFAEFRERMKTDPDYYDAQRAGWWVWGLSMWIGGGWCASANVSERRPEVTDGGGGGGGGGGGVHKRGRRSARNSSEWAARPDLTDGGQGVHRKLPDLYTRGFGRGIRAAAPERGEAEVAEKRPNARNGGQGVHRRTTRNHPAEGEIWEKRPVLGHGGHGGRGVVSPYVSEKIPNLSSHGGNGTGVTRLPSLGNARGVHGAEKPPCLDWFRALQARLRRVRVCCGDWTRVLGNSVIGTTTSRNSGMNPCGIFLDPPYSGDERAADLYGVDSGTIAKEVARWAREHGDDPDLRVALCGYEGEHEMPSTWTCVPWKAHRGYAGADNDNKNRERIWLSPHCLPLDKPQRTLFEDAGT
ncbi:MAG TPA: DNA adenine methylase [Polyangiaceae bacterium]